MYKKLNEVLKNMEKLISSDERIRRAEDLYYKRRNIGNYEDEEFKMNFKFIKRTVKITILCIFLFIMVTTIQNRHYIFKDEFLEDVNRFYTIEIMGKKNRKYN